ncbi:MAG: hypothetical protein AMXMBFR25_28780 [Lysobacterales bacterium]
MLALLAVLLLAAPLSAKQVHAPHKATRAAPAFVTIPGNPLRINVGADQSYQIFNTTLPQQGGQFPGQIYPTTALETADMGWFVNVSGTLYTPNFEEHPGGSATSFGGAQRFVETALSPLSGNGSALSPYTVSVSVGLGLTGLRAVKTISYVNGENYFSERFRLINTGGNAVQATIFLGSDIYLANSDAGVPFLEPTSSSPGGNTCPGVTPPYTILHIPLTPATKYTGAGYSSVWSQINANNLNNAISTGCIDNGAALQWSYMVPSFGSRTVLSATSFGDVPAITQFNVIEVNPGQGVIGTSLAVSIDGYGFQPDTTFSFGPGITVSDLVVVNATTANATLTIAPNANLGFRDVVATRSPGGIVATLVEGFVVTEPPIWNYMFDPHATLSTEAFQCIQAKFPGNPATNAEGWAPSEGQWSTEVQPGIPGPPSGLARALLDCYLHPLVWDPGMGSLTSRYCWLNPYPLYDGPYPDTRQAHLKIYDAVNHVCMGQQPGWPLYESSVIVRRQLFFPSPIGRSGFEDP